MNLNLDTTLGEIATLYTQKLQVKITAPTLKKALEQNPYYPSLYSLSEVFQRFGVENQSFNIPNNEFHKLEAPFLAYYNHQHGFNDFVLVSANTKHEVLYTTGSGKSHSVSQEQFLNNYRQVVFVAEPDETSGEKDYLIKEREEQKATFKKNLIKAGAAFSLIIFLGILLYSFLQGSSSYSLWVPVLIIVAKSAGLGAAVLLLIYEIDKTNSLVKSICTAGKKTNCDAVLGSKASKVFGLSWSEVGFFYFASTFLFLIIPGISFEAKVPWLAVAALLASPYILFSLYYQWRVVKQWCPLCLAALGALVIELLWSLNFNWNLPIEDRSGETPLIIAMVSASLLLPVVVWSFLKPTFQKAKDAPSFEAAYKRLQNNPEMFNAMLQQQLSAPDGWQNLGITIGNPNAKHTLLKVCNPFCGPCAKAHFVLEEIINRNDEYNLRIIFTATNQENDSASVIVKHLLAVAAKGDVKETTRAVDAWYGSEKKNYERLAALFPMNGELKQQDAKVEKMDKWCREAEIAYTPTLFVKGRKLPEAYSIEELRNIL